LASFSPILNNLDAEDLAVRLFAILRLQELTGNESIPEKMRQAAEKETDPALKLYLNWLAYPEKSDKEADPVILGELLQQKQPDWPRILRLLLQFNRQSAALALDTIRQASLRSLPGNLLPVLVGFFSRFGDSRDVELLESWCTNPNPAVTILAVEGLSRIQPDRLRNFLYPLLTSESAGIRSRAIRLLFRWHPEEALRQLSDMLESDIIDERRASLAHAFFLPFDRIKHQLIRFMIRESEPALLIQAGQILIINPDLEAANSVATVAVETSAEKVPIIKSILLQQCEFLARIKLIEESHESYADRLLTEATSAIATKRADKLAEAARNGQISNETDLATTTALLKQKFSPDLPPQHLLPLLESLILIDPAFLQPHLSALLQIRDINIQIAALSAMAKVNPVRAEKMLEQYLCSASPARRRTGIIVLARLERNFSRPLLLKTLAGENDRELLALIESQLTEPLPRESVIQLFRACVQSDQCEERQAMLKRLCLAAGMQPEEARQAADDCDFSHETIMLGRAEKQIADTIAPERAQSEKSTDSHADLVTGRSQFALRYQGLAPFARIQSIIESMSRSSQQNDEYSELLNNETKELQRFALQSASTVCALKRRKGFSPVKILKQNLSLKIPIWTEIAASLALMTPETARLITPQLQQNQWVSWPEAVLPFILKLVASTGRPVFSSSVASLLHHNRSEIRCAAILCLAAINPVDLVDSLQTLIADEDPEVAEIACCKTREIEARFRSGSTAAVSGKFFNALFARLQQMSSFSQAAVAGSLILLLSVFLLADQFPFNSDNDATKTGKSVRANHTAAGKVPLHRFEHWRQQPESGQERVVFGRIEENYSNAILLHSPALNASILIRHDQGVLPLRKDQHFNGRVKIENVDAGRIESTLLPTAEEKR